MLSHFLCVCVFFPFLARRMGNNWEREEFSTKGKQNVSLVGPVRKSVFIAGLRKEGKSALRVALLLRIIGNRQHTRRAKVKEQVKSTDNYNSVVNLQW